MEQKQLVLPVRQIVLAVTPPLVIFVNLNTIQVGNIAFLVHHTAWSVFLLVSALNAMVVPILMEQCAYLAVIIVFLAILLIVFSASTDFI